MRVLHDWDSVTISGRKALRCGISLVVYALSKWAPWLNHVGRIKRNNKELEEERLKYMETLIKLDELIGIEPIFGITDEVMERYSDEILQMKDDYGLDVRRHIHIGRPPDPNRLRLWEPPLSQSMKSWNFETDYIEGRGELEPGDLPLFHVDFPENVRFYIAYIYTEKKELEKVGKPV